MGTVGFQVTFFTAEGRQHGHQPLARWLMDTARGLGIGGATLGTAVDGVGRDGRVHSAHFFELADQPVEVTLLVTSAQWDALAHALTEAQANVVYAKTPVEFGVLGEPQAEA